MPPACRGHLSKRVPLDYRVVAIPSTTAPLRLRVLVQPNPIRCLPSPSRGRIITIAPSPPNIGATMPSIDWTSQGLVLTLAIAGVFLIVLSLVIQYLSARRGNLLVHAIGIASGLVLGAVGALYFLPPTPDCFANATDWYTVERGAIELNAVESGEVEPAFITHVLCNLHARTPGQAAGVIRWVIDEGKMVKKGDLLVELDDSEWRKELKEQTQTMTPARRKFLEFQIANCRIFAPSDGLAIHYIESRHMGPGVPSAVDEGELVKEGQRLLSLFDPSKMEVQTHVSDSQISRVRLGQAARVHVDRFPDRTLEGQVSHIANMPTRANPGSKGTYYAVWVKLSDPVAGLQPGMTAKVGLELVERRNVLRVPRQALMRRDNTNICFVKSGSRIVICTVDIGASDSQFVEIFTGLKEGEQVLVAPVNRFYALSKWSLYLPMELAIGRCSWPTGHRWDAPPTNRASLRADSARFAANSRHCR